MGGPQRAWGVVSLPLPQRLHPWSSHLLQLPVPAAGRDGDPPFPEPATGLHLRQAGVPGCGAEAQRGAAPCPRLPAWLPGLEGLRSRCHPGRPPSPPAGRGCPSTRQKGPHPGAEPASARRPRRRLAHKLKFHFIKAAHNQSLARQQSASPAAVTHSARLPANCYSCTFRPNLCPWRRLGLSYSCGSAPGLHYSASNPHAWQPGKGPLFSGRRAPSHPPQAGGSALVGTDTQLTAHPAIRKAGSAGTPFRRPASQGKRARSGARPGGHRLPAAVPQRRPR